MSLYRRRADGITITQARSEHAPQLEALQLSCFPTLDDAERFKARHYLHHLQLFAAGQIVALDGDRVVGATSTIRLDFDFAHLAHTFADIIQGGWLTSHNSGGAWLYGADISVSPEVRGRGIATSLYAARQELVCRLGLAGQITVGMMPGYGRVKDSISAEDYCAGVVSGAIYDPTLSMQIRAGFEPRALIANYLNDPACDHYGALLVLPRDKDVKSAWRENGPRHTRQCAEATDPQA